MLRRPLFCALALVAALAISPAGATAQTAKELPNFKKVVTSGYKVEYRRPNAPAWTKVGEFKSLDKASTSAKDLYLEGHEVRVTKFETVTLLRADGTRTTTTTTKRAPLRLPTGVSVVSQQRINEIFAEMRGQTDIAFRYPIDGCYARAHLMGRLMMEMGLNPGKAWAFDDRAMEDKKASPRLGARTVNHPKGEVWWKYHVAPMLGVRDSQGKVRMHVIDPSLFDRPVTLASWQARMVHPQIRYRARIDVTGWEQPPKKANGSRFAGRGYWPGVDSFADLDMASWGVMMKYKPLEGTDRIPPAPKRPRVTTVSLLHAGE